MVLTPADRLTTINAVLRLAVRHPNLLRYEAFEELGRIVRAVVPFARFAVTVPEPPSFRRVYATHGSQPAAVGFGARVEPVPGLDEQMLQGEPRYCDDTSLGTPLERLVAEAGCRSYAVFPMRPSGPGSVSVADMAFAFNGVAEARKHDQEIMQQVADIVGESFARTRQTTRERRLAMILETSSDAMIAWDRDRRITDTNSAAVLLAGRPSAELLSMQIDELLVPLPGAIGGLEAPRVELASRAEDGTMRSVVVASTLTEVEDDPLVRAHVLLRDLTRVVRAESEAAERLSRIRELEEQHRTLLDNAPLIIFRLDPTTRELVYLNRHAERLLGVPTAEALRTPRFLRAAHADPEGVAAFDAAVEQAAAQADSRQYEARLMRRGGDEITARGTVYPLVSDGGELVAIEGVLADVSVERAARTRLVQNDRLSTLGTLAAGIAHEINNPAAFILLGLDMLDRLLKGPGVQLDTAPRDSAEQLVEELRDSIRRIVDIARDLRLFASPPAPDRARRIVDVNRTVESALSLTRGQLLERAQIVRLFEEVPPVLMDDGRLGQVAVNLLVNAAQAMQKTPGRAHTVTVATRSDGNTVQIEVIDTGVGIPEENIARIWEPFFTTKTPDVGTGLGLSISREIVERAGGTIVVDSPFLRQGDERSGSRFVITLPAAGLHDKVTPISSPLPRIPSKPLRVLVVEDETALARALADALGRQHEVTLASGAEQAFAVLGERRFDVILCDLRMPAMSGESLYARVLEHDLEAASRFIFMTGVGFGADVERFLAAAGRPVLEKPFSAEAALDEIVRVANKAERTKARLRSP